MLLFTRSLCLGGGGGGFNDRVFQTNDRRRRTKRVDLLKPFLGLRVSDLVDGRSKRGGGGSHAARSFEGHEKVQKDRDADHERHHVAHMSRAAALQHGTDLRKRTAQQISHVRETVAHAV